MEAIKCPVCEGKQTVHPGFYGVGAETKCRSCEGRGYVLASEAGPTRYVPMPYYPYPFWPWPNYQTDKVWTTDKTPIVTWEPNTTGTLTVTTNPYESTSACLMSNDGTVQ
jgi:hypothetical protein